MLEDPVVGFRPLADTESIHEARAKLYRLWKANRRRAPSEEEQRWVIEEFLNLATTSTIATILLQKGLITKAEWEERRAKTFHTLVDNYVATMTGPEGWEEPK